MLVLAVVGAATTLLLRERPVTEVTWATDTPVTGEPTPGNPGTSEFMTVAGLIPGATYYFGLKSVDNAGNQSPVSNSPSTVASLGPTGSIKGTVKDASTGFKLVGVLVESDTGQSATTNKGGKYVLGGVLIGTRIVTVSANGYVTQQQQTNVTEGGNSTLDFALNPEPPATGSIQGSVTDSVTGKAVSGASVSVDTGQSNTTDTNGSYTLNNVPTGDHTVTVSASGYVKQQQQTSVTEGGNSTVNFALDPETSTGTGTVKGTVADANTGVKLSGVIITTDTDQSATTNKGGKYTIKDVLDGDHTVTASKDGYTAQSKNASVVADGTISVDFTLAPK